LLALVAAAATLLGQSQEPKSEFAAAVGQFSLALEGTFGDEGTRELEVYRRQQAEATAAQSRRLEIEGFRRDASLAIVNGDHAKAVGLLRQALEREPESAWPDWISASRS
jgi:hypothetical protein